MNLSPSRIAYVMDSRASHLSQAGKVLDCCGRTLRLFALWISLLSCLILGYTAPYSPSIGAASTPLYLLGGIDPTFFLAFQLAAVLLLFDASQRQERNRIDEVLDSKPVTNFEYLAGRVLGISLLLWLVVVLNVLAMECVGLVSNAIGFHYAEPIQLHSILNLLLLDAPVTLLFWSSFVIFLSAALRIRVLTVILAVAAMFGWFFSCSQCSVLLTFRRVGFIQ